MKNNRITAFSLTIALLISLCACGGKSAQNTDAPQETLALRVAALKGPTAMGMVYMMDGEQENSGNSYEFTLAGSADEITPKLIKGEIDIACVPANLASVLYNKTSGGIVILAINTLGILYIVENGETIRSISDLAGKTIVGAGKGSTPEYVLRYLLSENGIDPDRDVSIDWKSEHSECVTALATGSAAVALLPQPFVTVAEGKIDGLRTALDLTEEWGRLDNRSALITGVVIARKELAESHSGAMESFLTDYAASVENVNADTADAAKRIENAGIVDAAVAEKALPYCHIVCLIGEEMKQNLSGYLQVLYDSAPESVGGMIPGDDFYFAMP